MLDALESRLLLAVTVSDYEQYFLELLNRARANPAAEAARYGIDLNEGLAPGTISAAAKEPLVFMGPLIQAAQDHSAWQITTNTFSHTGLNGTTPGQRMENAGYLFIPPYTWGENIGWQGSTGPISDLYPQYADLIHRKLFVDTDIAGRGHRINMMNASFREAGMGIALGPFTSGGTTYNAMMVTQDFAASGASQVYVTGVVYSDAKVNDDFYTPGEGYAGVTITATRVQDGLVGTTTSFSSGGYNLALPAGTWNITASGGGLPTPQTYLNVVVGSQNVKLDFTPQTAQVYPPAQTMLEDAALVFSSTNGRQIVLADTTGNAQGLRLSLTSQNGTLSLSRVTGLTFESGDGTGDTAMTFSGTLADVNAALNGLTFQPTANYNGAASLQIVSQAVLAGGVLSNLDDHTIGITVTAVNDAPSFTRGPDQSVLEDALLVTVPGWAGALSTGPADEAGQTISFLVSTNNSGLFAVAPSVSADGTLTFRPAGHASGSATVTVTMVDSGGTAGGGVNAATQTFNITVQAVNDAPINAVPPAQMAPKSGVIVFSAYTGNGISVSDLDAGNLPLQVTLNAASGTVTLGSLANVQVTGNGTSQVILTGSATAINYALSGLTFRATAGAAQGILQVVTSDQGNSGSGGPLSDTDGVVITVPANEAPVNTVPSAQTAGQEAALVFSLATGNRITVADADAGTIPIRVTLSTPNGVLTVGSSLNVTVEGNGTGTLTVTGTAAAINAALNGLVFRGSVGFIGQTTLQVLTEDLGATGSGPARSDSDTIAITVTQGRLLALNGLTPVSFTDASGDLVWVYLIGGTGTVYLPAGDRGDIQRIVASNTTEASVIYVVSAGKTTIREITVNGPVGTISAPTGTLTGTLTIGATTKSWAGATIVLDRLAEAAVTSQMPITTFIAYGWSDADATADTLTAPRLGTMVVYGNLQADLSLKGAADVYGQSLGVLYVLGDMAGSVDLGKAAGTIYVKSWSSGTLSGTYATTIVSLGAMAASINLTGQNAYGAALTVLSVAGALSSPSILLVGGSVTTIVSGNWSVGTLRATYAGSLIVLGTFTGTVDLSGQDAYGRSLLLLQVTGNMTGANVYTRGSVVSALLGSIADTTFFAGMDPLLTGLPDGAEDFRTPLNPAQPISIGLLMITSPTGQMANTRVAAPTLGTVIIRNVQKNTGSQPWGLAAYDLIRVYVRYETGVLPVVKYNLRSSLAADGRAEVRVVKVS